MPAANKIKECSTLVPERHSDMADVGNSGSKPYSGSGIVTDLAINRNPVCSGEN